MKEFIRYDGVALKLDSDIRKAILSRPSANPRSNWTDHHYAVGAKTKLERWRQRRSELVALGVQLERARVLDVACGNGIDCLLLGLEPVDWVIGIDLRLSLFLANKKGARHRRLAAEVLSAVGKANDPWKALCELPVCLLQADATKLPFGAESFDLILSRSFLEHMIPIEAALSELERVLVPGGLMYHLIDPYFWLRGCHAPGLVDIPWAHARLSPNEYKRFVAEYEGEQSAIERCRWLESLNHFTLKDYRAVFHSSPFEILSWRETPSSYAEQALAKHPDVIDTVVDHVGRDDLICDWICVLARKRG